MTFISFIGWFISQLYHLLDFKIFDFPISVVNILIGCFVFGAFISFIQNVVGVSGSSTGFDLNHAHRLKTSSDDISTQYSRMNAISRRSVQRHSKGGY